MKYVGIRTIDSLPPTSDAGAGRALWLAERIGPKDTVVDLGGVGQMLHGWHDPQLVTALDDLSGFGPGYGHRILAGTFYHGDVQALPFEDDRFDVAVLTEVLEHVPLPWVAMREAGRVARRVLVTVPCEGRWRVATAFRIGGHIRHYTLDMLADHLRRADLDGTVGFLDFASWSFLVADVTRREEPSA